MSPSQEDLQQALQHGALELKGQFMFGSNYTFLVEVTHEDQSYSAVYKPSRGEQPLWDFPESTLAQREVAAYLVSEAFGFHFVPFTALREDGPLGPGSIQQYIECDPEYHYFNFTQADKERLRPTALFDLLINNADRKGSHVLVENETNKIWLIDHGICFHEQDKLRTVIWDFAGEPIPDDLLFRLSSFLSPPSANFDLPRLLQPYLSPGEIAALCARAQALTSSRVFPHPPPGRRAFPYPPV